MGPFSAVQSNFSVAVSNGVHRRRRSSLGSAEPASPASTASSCQSSISSRSSSPSRSSLASTLSSAASTRNTSPLPSPIASPSKAIASLPLEPRIHAPGITPSSSSSSTKTTTITSSQALTFTFPQDPSEPLPSTLIASTSTKTLSSLLASVTHSDLTFMNWGLSYACKPAAVFLPASISECQCIVELARREGRRLRVAGVGHSPSDLACTDEYMLRTTKLDRVLHIDASRNLVTAQAGIPLENLTEALASHSPPFAFSTLGSISEQSIAGVITTPTHGSGVTFPILPKYIEEITLITALGDVLTCSEQENSDIFMATLCGMGCTGFIYSATVRVERAFRLRELQETYTFKEVVGADDDEPPVASIARNSSDLIPTHMFGNLEEIAGMAQHVRFWWFAQNDNIRFSIAERTYELPTQCSYLQKVHNFVAHSLLAFHAVQFLLFLGLFRIFSFVNSWTAHLAEWCTKSGGTGERQATVKIDHGADIFNVDCRYPQHTIEFALPLSNAAEALRELRTFYREEFSKVGGLGEGMHFPVEVRFSEADDVWLSPSRVRTCWIGFVQYKPYKISPPYFQLFAAISAILVKHGGKPHWAKAHHYTPAQLQEMYGAEEWQKWQGAVRSVDRDGFWRNAYVSRHLFGDVDVREGAVRYLRPGNS